MWKVKTGERAPFWCTLILFNQYYGKCFIPPIIVHQAKEYSQDIQFNIPLDWTVHHTPSGYMDRDGWLKSMTQFSKICGATPFNNQIFFFNGHDSHFNECALRQTNCRNTQPFLLKEGDPINDQPNDNGPNSKLRSLYNLEKAVCMLKYGTTNFLPRHMNYLLIEAWDAFKMSDGNIIMDSFVKTNLPPLRPTDLTTNTQACAASVPKAE